MSRLIMHIDLDAFYAAVEQRDNPELRGRPVVVGAEPGRRGVVTTCSYEARRYGVRSAMPISEAVRRLPKDCVYIRPRMAHYAAVSREIMAALHTVSPIVEQVSIDEAYLDISGLERLVGTPRALAEQARAIIAEQVRLTASVGVGPNRLIAKLASDYRKPNGLTVVAASQVQGFLDPMPAMALRGVGKKTAPALARLGLRTIADVRQAPLAQLRERLGAQFGTKLYNQARGIASDTVLLARERKSISKEVTYDVDVTDALVLRDTLRWAAQEVGCIARHEGLTGTVVSLKIRFPGFETHARTITLDVATANDKAILRAAWDLYRLSDWRNRPVRLIGLGLSGWRDRSGVQADMFTTDSMNQEPRDARLYETLDEITRKFGKESVRLGINRRK